MPPKAQKADEETETHAPPLPRQSINLVKVKVTKFGSGKVSTGVHVTGEGDIMAANGDVLEVSETIAKALESLGLAETV